MPHCHRYWEEITCLGQPQMALAYEARYCKQFLILVNFCRLLQGSTVAVAQKGLYTVSLLEIPESAANARMIRLTWYDMII